MFFYTFSGLVPWMAYNKPIRDY